MSERPMLLYYDGSDHARRAIETAAHLLSPRPAVVVEVAQPVTAEEEEAAFLLAGAPDNLQVRLADDRRTARNGARLARAHGLDATERIEVASPVWAGVAAAADEIDASVVVVGSRSLAHELAAHAERPVLIVGGALPN